MAEAAAAPRIQPALPDASARAGASAHGAAGRVHIDPNPARFRAAARRCPSLRPMRTHGGHFRCARQTTS